MIGAFLWLAKGFAILVVLSGLIGGLFALYATVTSGWGILVGFVILGAIAAVLVASTRLTGRRHRDDFDDAEAHMGPLRQPGDAETALLADLGRKRMLLRGQRKPGRHAAQPAPLLVIPPSAEARTETIPAVHEATEVIPVLTGPVPLFEAEYPLGDTAVMEAFGGDES